MALQRCSLSSFNGHYSWEKFLMTGKRQMTCPSSRQARRRIQLAGRSASPQSDYGASPYKSFPNTRKRVTSSRKHRFMKGKSCLNNLMAFYDKMPSMTDKRMVGMLYTLFNKAFDTESHSVFFTKLVRCGLADEVSGKLVGLPVSRSCAHCKVQLMASN